MNRPLALAPWLVVLLAATCAANVQVSLPLEGHYRAGRYMPVRVVARGEAEGDLTISAPGAVPTRLRLDGRSVDAIVPLLVVREPLGTINWRLQDGRSGQVAARLFPLGEEDRLVGYAGGGASTASVLFSPEPIIPVPLELADPLRGSPVAWEVLDAAVLDQAPDPPVRHLLVAGGTAIVVRREPQAEPGWVPWRRAGGAWVMAHQPIGPRGAIIPDAYDPAYAWKAGRPATLRRQLLLAAVVFAILVVFATLWRSRLAVVAVVAISLVTAGAIALRASRLSPVVTAGGTVFVRRGRFVQSDKWKYVKSLAPATDSTQPRDLTKPIFASEQHFERSGVTLVCRADGVPDHFELPITPQTTIAFLSRSETGGLEPGEPDPDARGSPLWPLVRQLYLSSRGRAAGEVASQRASPEAQEAWPGIVIDQPE